MTGYSECRDVPAPLTRELEQSPISLLKSWFVGGRSPENSSVVSRMPMYPGPPPGCVPGGLDMSSGSPAYDPHHGGIPPVASLRARDPSDGWGGGAGRTGLGLEPAGTPH